MHPPLRNFTVALPAGTSNHGDRHILCTPASWDNIAIFFIGNYIAHAATVKLPPATSMVSKLRIYFSALLMPASGLVFALQAFTQVIRGIGKSEAQKASIARGLCMYARSEEWRPPGRVEDLQASVRPREFLKLSASENLTRSLPKKSFQYLQHLSQTLPTEYLRDWANAAAKSIVLHELDASEDYQSVFRLMSPSASAQCANIPNAEIDQRLDGNESLTAPVNLLERIHGPGEENLAFLRVSKCLGGKIIRPAVIPNENVHGINCKLPGYELVHVPEGTKIFPNPLLAQTPPDEAASTVIPIENMCSERSVSKSLISFFQLVYSVVTLWRSRGNQLDTYGYAAFSLSVAPYAVMAGTNLLANAICPQYQKMSLVRNEVLEEAESLYGIRVNGSVGELHCAPDVPSRQPGGPHLPLEFDGSGSRFVVQEKEQGPDARGDPVFPLKIISRDDALGRGLLPSKEVCIPSYADYVQDVEEPWQLLTSNIGSITLGLCLIFGLFSAAGQLWMAQRRDFPLAKYFGAMWASKRDTSLLTPDLLQRLGLDPERPKTRLFKGFMLVMKIFNYTLYWEGKLFSSGNADSETRLSYTVAIVIAECGFASIWGFIVVGQMLTAYGNCFRVY
ncbi:MAG: hypothetical protein LQ338_002072 [Usnochroma carphineum]|nr:MAG: hypothetical protein LQ338_002072 [Usnochroma carphineum]